MRTGTTLILTLLALALLTTGLAGIAGLAAAGGGHAHGHGVFSPGDHADVGTSPSLAFFPGHQEVQTRLDAFADHPWVTLHQVGQSVEGREIVLAEVVDPNGSVPVEERAVTFILTQQHGNEPAGTPAALELLENITAGAPIADTLDDQVLLLLPMANPDGSEEAQRHNAQDKDVNRDHIELSTPEAEALHRVLNQWRVHVAMDHHEYGGTGFGNPVPVRVYDYDLTTLFPVHGNAGQVAADQAARLMYEGIWPAAEAEGYTSNEYGEMTVAGVPVQQLAGGPDPGIMRNHLGLHHIAGLLVETRIDQHPNPFHDAQRRADIHRTVMEATLTYVHEHAAAFVEARNASEHRAVEHPAERYLEGETTGQMPDGFRVPTANAVNETIARHGLPSGVLVEDGRLYDARHALQGHVAAALHPASSRALTTAEMVTITEPTSPATEEALTPQATDETPAPTAAVAVLALAMIALLARWHDRP